MRMFRFETSETVAVAVAASSQWFILTIRRTRARTMRKSNSQLRRGLVHVPTFAMLLTACLLLLFRSSDAFLAPSSSRHSTLVLAAGTDPQENEDNKRQGLLDQASNLRQEAIDLESKLRTEQKGKPMRRSPETSKPEIPVCKQIEDSAWTFTYRFASTPESDDKDESEKPREFYRGKLTVKFRADGYTDIVAHEPGVPSNALSIIKTWGWDIEQSSDDDNDYLMFSVDVELPDTDATSASSPTRFYLQAQQEREGETIVLKGGTVTMKGDVIKPNTPGFWALLSPKGILAEFRYVGDFVGKPSAIKE